MTAVTAQNNGNRATVADAVGPVGTAAPTRHATGGLEHPMAAGADEVLAVESLGPESVRPLFAPQPGPCLSLYLPTHRNVPDNTVDVPAFLHLVEALELSLSATRPRGEIERLLLPFRLLGADADFWRHTRAGLVMLAADGRARAFLLQRPVPPLAMVAARFHTMPLVRAVTALDRFDVLALTSRSARVWAGRAWHDARGAAADPLDPVPLGAAAGSAWELTPADVVSAETLEPHRVKHGMGPAGRADAAFVHGGFGSKRDDVDRDTEIFLRHVDRVVAERVSRRSEAPLVLVAPARLAATFRGLAKNPLLLEEHVDLDPHLLGPDALADRVVPVFARARDARISREVEAFAAARDRGLGSGDLADVARAAVGGQVAMLLVEADRFESGRFDHSSGAVEFDGGPPGDLSRTGDRPAAGGEDLYGAVAETVLAKGGTVVSLARNEMPTESGVAAIYRYA
jgi:hypothetical protein